MRQVDVRSVRPRMVSLALGVSVAAVAAGTATPVSAQCSPDPTAANATTICAGTDTDGLTITTNGTAVTVAVDASVTAGEGRTGTVVVAQTGNNTVVASLDNAGTITSTSGTAIATGGDPGFVGLTSLVNRDGATIAGSQGAIAIAVQFLNNAGRIDGGAGSAVSLTLSPGGGAVVFPSSIVNSGTITSSSSAATLASFPGSILNSGRIENGGLGAIIDAGGRSVGLNNTATGVIATAGPVAIRSDFQVSLTNAGSIIGSIVGGTGFDDRIDNRAGTITGDVRLNAGNDHLIARIGDTRLVEGVTGTIDGGAGTDVLELIVGRNRTVDAAALPTGFEILQLDIASDAALTIAGPPLAGGYYVRGTGTVAIGSDITTTGRILNPSFVRINVGPEVLRFVNDRAVTTTLTSDRDFAIRLEDVESAVNTGTITAIGGNGVTFSSTNKSVTTNSGSITATGTALQVDRRLENSGLIRSTAGTAVVNGLGGGGVRSVTSENSGRIEGVTTGLSLDSLVLVNSGAISASGGVGVATSGSTIDNRAGGVISGTIAGIRSDGFFENYVANAGVINGAVDFASDSRFSTSRDWFIDRGGSVNGDVRLGGGDDVFVTELGRNGGVTGMVDGGAGLDEFRRRTTADAEVVIAAPPTTFELIGYEVAHDSRLKLTATAPLTTGLSFSGQGSVDLTADVSLTDRSLIDLSRRNSAQALEGFPFPTANRLDVVSRGTLSLTVGGMSFSAAVEAGSATFENAGTITVTSSPTNNLQVAAVSGLPFFDSPASVRISNSGVISLSGRALVGVLGGEELINTGRITGTGSTLITGVSATRTITNSGTIDTTGTAVSLGSDFGFAPSSLTNSGAISSSTAVAVRSTSFGGTVDNQAGGTISGRVAIALRGGAVANAGVINGTVQLGIPSAGGASFEPGAFVSTGGTVNGSVLFGAGNDLFLQIGESAGVTRIIDGGDGFDVFGRGYMSSTTVALGTPGGTNFEGQLIQARGAGTVVAITSENPTDGPLFVGGDGRIVNRATMNGVLIADTPFSLFDGRGLPAGFGADLIPAEIRNEGTIAAFRGIARRFDNAGTIGIAIPAGDEDPFEGELVSLDGVGELDFVNSGVIARGGAEIDVSEATRVTIGNSGTINGELLAELYFDAETPGMARITNTGAITGTNEEDATVGLSVSGSAGGSVTFANLGTISAVGRGGSAMLLERIGEPGGGELTFAVTNGGTLAADAGGFVFDELFGSDRYLLTQPAAALAIVTDRPSTGTVVNTATGRLSATGERSTALGVIGSALDLINAGAIVGTVGTELDPADELARASGQTFLAGAIQTFSVFGDFVRNSGTITGSIDLGFGDDRIENRGAIDGAVFLRAGDDRYLQGAAGTLTGAVDGGDGLDVIEIDGAGGGRVAAERFTGFERLVQSGAGVVSYSGAFTAPTIELTGGGVRVDAGSALSFASGTAVTGTDAAERVEVAGTLNGAVALGGGDDLFAEIGGGRASGPIDGGAGTDLYRVSLAGDRAGLSATVGFERLAVDGSGTLSVGLDQRFEVVTLSGVGLDVMLNGFTIGTVEGAGGAERLVADGDVMRVSMGAGDDMVRLGGSSFAGRYDGGAGVDTLRFASGGPATLSGEATGFETVLLDGGVLEVTGTLGGAVAFGDGAQTLGVSPGGRLQGSFDLGAGDDRFRFAAGGSLTGSVAGGAGRDRAELGLAGDMRLTPTVLSGFETLAVTGPGLLTLAGGSFAYERLEATGDVRVANDAALDTAVRFGGGDNWLLIAGGFAGSVAGGGGIDLIEISGGSAATPVAFGQVTEIEAFRMTGGFATIAGAGGLGSVNLSGGRLVGLAGSTLNASTFDVRQEATFGSVGTVKGNVAVAGTLSPGASPGTMTVNGSVALAGTSVSVFEITPTASDRLVVNGTVSIASGATLQLLPTGQLQPGQSLDLITASGGITGSFTNVVKPDSLFGFLLQQPGRIQLLGQFRNDGAFGPQVGAAIDYTNSVLVSGRASAALLAAAPELLGANGSSNAAAFALIAPEAYASAGQAAVENGLTLADAGRGSGFASRRAEAGLFTFGQFTADQRTLRADPERGTARTRFGGYGVSGGLGYAGGNWSLGGFVGYMDGRQRLDGRGAATELNGAAFGVHGRANFGAFGLTATAAYAATEADTRRALPGGSARGVYDLTGLTLDVSATYEVAIGADWTVRPRVGGTVVRVDRDSVRETGSAAFGATVAGNRDAAGFIDGALTVAGGTAPGATVRPFATLGLRYQVAGREGLALAGFGGGGIDLIAEGAERARVVGTAALGAEADLWPGVTLFSAVAAERGEADRRESARIGVRISF